MDKDHLIELISSSLLDDKKRIGSNESYEAIRANLSKLNLEQLRVMSKEFIL